MELRIFQANTNASMIVAMPIDTKGVFYGFCLYNNRNAGWSQSAYKEDDVWHKPLSMEVYPLTPGMLVASSRIGSPAE